MLLQASGREAGQRSSLRGRPAGQQSQRGHVAGRPGTAQPAVEQPSAAVHPQEADAVITQAQAGIPEMPAAITEDRPVFAEPAMAYQGMAGMVGRFSAKTIANQVQSASCWQWLAW